MRRYFSDEPVRLEIVAVRLTADEKKLIRDLAQQHNTSMAEFLRSAAFNLSTQAA